MKTYTARQSFEESLQRVWQRKFRRRGERGRLESATFSESPDEDIRLYVRCKHAELSLVSAL